MSERTDVRERAVRVLGEGASLATMRQLYGDIENSALRERVLRMVGEQRTAEEASWLEHIATDRAEAMELRDRALRMLGERAIATNDLFTIYEDVSGADLRRRVIRLLTERGDDAAVEKLRVIAETDANRDLRRYASRRLAETR